MNTILEYFATCFGVIILISEPGHEMIGSWNTVNTAQTVLIWFPTSSRQFNPSAKKTRKCNDI